MTATALHNIALGACAKDPDRWTTAPDDEAKALCRACPRRWLCAREAVESTGAEGP
jgi:WhiB family redox-sensing transcriptional regulator